MNESFDDMIRRRLEGHESKVPDGMFDAINNLPEVQDAFFDDAIRSKLAGAETAVPTRTFDAINAAIGLEHLGFDSAIRDKVEQHASAVPADMWQRIMAEKERRHRPVAWWWMAATVLLLTGAGTAFLLKHNKQEANTQMTAVERKEASKQSIHPAEQPGKENSFTNNGAYSKPDKQYATTKQPNTTASAHPVQSTGNLANQDGLGKSETQVSTDQQAIIIKKNVVGKALAKQPGTDEEMTTETADELQAGATLQAREDASLVTAHLILLGLLRNAARLSPGQLLKAKPHAPVIPCPTNSGDKRNDWYVDVYGSAFLLQKNIQDKGISKNAKAGFDTTLHRQVSFNAGINLVKNIGENFLLKTGLQYNRINESFRLTQINERRLVTTISVRTVIIAPGDTVRIRDTSTVEQIGTAQHRTQNHYTQWDIPLIIGYEFGGENIRLNANAGIITNIRSGYKGEMVADSTQQIIDINNYKGAPVYRKTVGFSLYAGLSILKPLSEKVSLLIEPHARIGLGNTTNSSAWFNQKNSTWGLSLGLRYKFGGSRQRIY